MKIINYIIVLTTVCTGLLEAKVTKASKYSLFFSGSYQKVYYGDINNQLTEYHNTKQKDELLPIGIGLIYRQKNILLTTHYSFNSTDNKFEQFGAQGKINFQYHNLSLCIGYDLSQSLSYALFPYIGTALNILKIKTSIPYNIRDPDCFFQGYSVYSNWVLGLEIGCTLIKEIKSPIKSLQPFGGLTIASIIAPKNDDWSKKIKADKPIYNANSFLIRLLFGITFK